MKLSPHFSTAELEHSQTAARLGIDNRIPPNLEMLNNVHRLAATLELVRDACGGAPVHISSGYRSPALNAAIPGSAKASAHMDGRAADFTVPSYGPPRTVIATIIEAGIEFDQLIHEFDSWVHLAVAPRGALPRRMLLTVDRHGTTPGVEGVR